MEKEFIIKVIHGGPYLLEGDVKLVLPSGDEKVQSGTLALCRCGKSNNKPFCDGTHAKINFDE